MDSFGTTCSNENIKVSLNKWSGPAGSPSSNFHIIITIFEKHVRSLGVAIHGVKKVRIRSYSGPHFFSRNAGKSGKNAAQNNSKYGLFLRSGCWMTLFSV